MNRFWNKLAGPHNRTSLTGMLGGVVCAMGLMLVNVADAQDGPPRGGFGGPGGFGPGPGGPGGMGNPMFGLLRNEAVREEIELDEDQAAALKKLAESMGRPERPDFDFRNASPEERREFFEKMREQMEEREENMKLDLEAILLPEQMERLEQLSIQARGVMALSDPEVIKQLKLSEAQIEKMKTVREQATDDMRSELREMFSSGNREGIREKMEAMRGELEEKILAVLTDEQKSEFEEMKGKPFDREALRPAGMGGPGGPAMRGRGMRGRERGGFGGGDRPRGNRPGQNRQGGDGSDDPS